MSDIKEFVENLHEKPVLIYGLGRSGMSALKALKKAGAHIVAGDDNDDSLALAKKAGAELLDDVDYDYGDYAFLILSPGLPFTHPKPHWVVEKAKAADVEIICDIELFSRIYKNIKAIGVTGTNGKSTTSSLLNHMLNKCGIPAELGGNIGTPVFDLKIPDEKTWLVLEISSFQIDLCPSYRPDIAVLLNLTPDHIDRHGDMENYCAVKERLSERSKSSDYNIAVICSDDPYMQKVYARAKDLGLRKVIEVSTEKTLSAGVYVEGDMMHDTINESSITAANLSRIPTLKGIHNYQNAACAYLAATLIGIAPEKAWDSMQDFPGLNHRQFLVRTINGVTYVNDSKSTNAASAAVALGYRDNVYWIVGGRKKKTGLDGLEEFFPRIKHAFLIGESTEDFADWFDKYGIEFSRCYDLDKAVRCAHDMAQKNRGQPGGAGVVLLSPACASFDQFTSFEDRGDKFTDFIKALDEN